MRPSALLARPYLRAYGALIGAELDAAGLDAELERRLAPLEPANRAYLGLSAALVHWLLPLLLMGRPRSFAGLEPREQDACLERLQNTPSPLLRAAFFGAKTLALFIFYASPERLRRLGYRP